jgi:hypothetical protein
MDWTEVLTIVGTGIGVVGFIYQFLRNFKHDFENKLNSFEKRMDLQDQRVMKALDLQDQRVMKALNLQDERIFLLATGKSLSQAMTEAKRNMESK